MITDCRIDIIRNRVRIGELKATQARIDFDQSKAVMRSMSVNYHGANISQPGVKFDMFRDRLRPVLITDKGERPLGIYMIVSAPRTISDTEDYIQLEAYDETMIAKQAAFETRRFYAAGTTYQQIIENLLTELGFSDIYREESTAATADDLELAVGDNVLEAINDMLDAMNYQHLYADENGTLNIRRVKDPTEPAFTYKDSQTFSIMVKITENTDIYDLPNVLVGVYSPARDAAPIVYKKVNDDPNSIISTVNRGYKVVKMIQLYNSATQEDLEAYVERMAFEAMQATETVTFTTVAEAGHEPTTAVQLDTDKVKGMYIETGWTMDLAVGSYRMTHTAERKVFV